MHIVVINAIVAVVLANIITLNTKRERTAVTSIGAVVAVVHIVYKVAKIVKVAIFRNAIVAVSKASMADRIAPTAISDTCDNIVPIGRKAVAIERMAVMRQIASRMRTYVGKEKIGTPNTIMQTHANTKYSTGIAKESSKG